MAPHYSGGHKEGKISADASQNRERKIQPCMLGIRILRPSLSAVSGGSLASFLLPIFCLDSYNENCPPENFDLLRIVVLGVLAHPPELRKIFELYVGPA